MRNKGIYWFVICGLWSVVFLASAGCFYTNVDLGSLWRLEPLEEKVVKEGTGDKGGGTNDKVLLLDIAGVITNQRERPQLGPSWPGVVSWVRQNLDMAEKDESIRAVVVRIDSPGGEVTACDIISYELREFRKRRRVPLVALFMSVAASGGYYVAASCDRIVSHPTAVTGSIGVVMTGFGLQGLMEKLGVRNQTITSGPHKDIGTWFRDMTEEERKLLQEVIDSEYQRFVSAVREGRKSLGEEDWSVLKDGRIFSAEQAKRHHLVDEIGYLDDAVNLAEQLAGVKGASWVVYQYRSEPVADVYGYSHRSKDDRFGLASWLGEGGLSSRHQLYYLWPAGLKLIE